MSNSNLSSNKSLEEVNASVNTLKYKNKHPIRQFGAFIGPAYLIGVGYMDPGNWATDLAAGSQFGYSLLWVLVMSNLMAFLLQSLCARLGIVTGMDLAQASRASFKKLPNFMLYILAEIAIVACDLAEVIGMAIGLYLLFHLPMIYGVFASVITTFLIFFLMNKGIKKMEVFIISLIFIIGVAFLINLFIVKPDMVEVAKGLQPSFLTGSALYIAIGILGATVMPHNLYLHSSLVQTRKIEHSYTGIKKALKYNIIDTAIALNMAFFVNASILILAGAAFFTNGYYNIEDIGDAHTLLNSIFGSLAPTLFAIALIAAGQSSTITGTLAGQIVMEGYLHLRIKLWIRRLLTRSLAIIPALVAIIYFGDSSLGKLLVLSQVVLSLQLGFAVIPLIRFCSHKKDMKQFLISNKIKFLAWLCAFIIVGLNAKLVFEEVGGWLINMNNIFIYIIVGFIILSLIALLIYITFAPLPKTLILTNDHNKLNLEQKFNELSQVNFNKIAIAVEFKTTDLKVLQYALNQGNKNTEYLLIHVVESAATNYLGKDVGDNEYLKDQENIAKYKSYLENKGYKVNTHISYGKVATAIIKTIKEENADLLVIGSHGHKTLADLIFGNTINKVRHNVDIPVLVAEKSNK